MRFDIGFTQTASDHLRAFRKIDQTLIFDAIEEQLRNDATTETRNRKRLSENELADWNFESMIFACSTISSKETARRL